MNHPIQLKQATARGAHLQAANDPLPGLSQADKDLAAMFDGPLDGETVEAFNQQRLAVTPAPGAPISNHATT